MKALRIARINVTSPYKVWKDGKAYRFETDHGISYIVDFDADSNTAFTCYWFNLTNPRHVKSPGDVKIAQTVICIIEEFFQRNPDVLLYMCSTDDNHQAQRSRLFLRWFSGYEQQKRYLIKTAEVSSIAPSGKPMKEYIALIVPREHPLLEDIVRHFDDDVQMFNDSKP